MDPKACLRALTLELRHELEGRYDDQGARQAGDLERRLGALGVWRDRDPKAVDELRLSPEDAEARRVVDGFVASRREAGLTREEALAEYVRESAYGWANRLLALRCMEARALIDEVVLQKEAYGGRSLQHQRLANKQPERCAGEDEGLFAALFDELGRQGKELPLLFRPTAPEVALRPSVAAVKRCVGLLSGTVVAKGQEAATDEVFTAADALGWAYQYWNLEEKDRVFAAAAGKGPDRKKHKIEGADIVPATCFYTDSYMVSFLVQNSLGATWMGMHPGSRLAEGWAYYVRDADRAAVKAKPVREITFLDPACGSGHFLIEAFDLFYAMYVEEGALGDPVEICASILEHNIFGIDIDERAVQFAALALVMKAKEKAPGFVPRRINLVATNIRLPGAKGHLEEFLRKHPEDEQLKPALLAIFEALAHADELGSLLQIEEPVEKELRFLQGKFEAAKSWPGQMVLLPGAAKPVQGALPLGVESYEAWKGRTLERLREHFEAEAGAPDLGAALFGEAATKGVSLVDVLTRRYDVVAANPPYMGSKSMGPILKRHLDRHFEAGKRDLYATFIMRCIELAIDAGRVAMVTQQSWMFLRSFTDLRALDGERAAKMPNAFGGVLRDTTIEMLPHLGPHAFSDVSGEVVNSVLFVLACTPPTPSHKLMTFRLVGSKSPEDKLTVLRNALKSLPASHPAVFRPLQRRFPTIPQATLCYWLQDRFFDLLAGRTLGDMADVCQGLATADDVRFVRFVWEMPPLGWEAAHKRRWVPFEKGGGYGKWFGHHFWVVEWAHDGRRMKQVTIERYGNAGKRIYNEHQYFKSGWTYSYMASGSLGVRRMSDSIFAHKSPAILAKDDGFGVGSIANCRFASAVARALSATVQLPEGCVARIPFPEHIVEILALYEAACVDLKSRLVVQDPTERAFDRFAVRSSSFISSYVLTSNVTDALAALLHTYEAISERQVLNLYDFSDDDLIATLEETGTPAGWRPTITGYDDVLGVARAVPNHSASLLDFSLERRGTLSPSEYILLKQRLRSAYETGVSEPHAGEDAADDEDDESDDDSGGHVPIPAETFLEELSQKLEIHPISVYWLLRELREKDGVVCLPELRRFVEDHFTVLILRLLGHRWPRQIEAGEPLPPWADDDGVIPLLEGAGEPPLLARVRDRIAEDFGAERVAAVEQELQEIMGKPLSAWIAADFFKRHVSQFRKRPIAWQIESRPPAGAKRRGRGVAKSAPAFSCLVYYHRLNADLLPKIRTQYVGPLRTRMQTELHGLETTTLRTPDQDARRLLLEGQIEELRDLDARLAEVSAAGFTSPALDASAAKEPLDARTSRDGVAPAPSTRDAFLAQERRYDPDLNDGVRVNIAPFQKAGLLAAEVIAAKDLDKAIADRAEWRADERRWCREGKLPRPGWWPAGEDGGP